MKNKKMLAILPLTAIAASTCLIACTGAEKSVPVTPPLAPELSADAQANALTMSVTNKTNTATAVFTAAYSDNGIVLSAEVTDSDVYTGIVYSYGYDDNVEYLINLKSSQVGWNGANTFHFLITADGDTFLQKANSPSGFGDSYAVSLKCVYGGNFSYKAERTKTGYKTEVFLGYDLLGLDKATAYGNLSVCPAMRNTRDYADTVWAFYGEYGCVWNNASTFIKVGADGYQTE